MSFAARAMNRLQDLYTKIWRRNKAAGDQMAAYPANLHSVSAGAQLQQLEPRLMLSAAMSPVAEPMQQIAVTEIQIANSADIPLTDAADTSGLIYRDKDDGTISISSCPDDVAGDLIIPDTIDGKTVTSIDNYAFYYCSDLTSVTISDNIDTVDPFAFAYCDAMANIYVSAGNTTFASVDGILFSHDLTTVYKCPTTIAGAYDIPAGVTTVGPSAFWGCGSLTSVTVPDSVTTIGNSAFSQCQNLASVEFAGEVTIENDAFKSCTALTNLEFPADATIGDRAFAYCSGLTSVSFAGSVTTGYQAFFSCQSLESVDFAGSATIGVHSFERCVDLETVEFGDSATIAEGAFYYCFSFTSITVSADNTACESFDGVLFNKDMTTLILCPTAKTSAHVIPDGVTTIRDRAFDKCESLTGVTIADSVKTIGDWAFSGCESLSTMSIPQSVETIGSRAFGECLSLTRINVATGNTAYASINGVLFNKARTTLIQCPASKTGAYVIPSSVKTIGDYAFEQCKSLTSIDMPDSVTVIENNAFSECRSITSIKIGNNVTYIGESAFRYCSSLSSLTISASVTTIEYEAFYGCSTLESATFEGDAPASFGTDVFPGENSAFKIYFYKGATGFATPTWQGYPCEMIGGGLLGDATGDGIVNLDDFIVIWQNFGTEPAEISQGDLNANGVVDLDDFIILKQNYGNTSASAAPAASADTLDILAADDTAGDADSNAKNDTSDKSVATKAPAIELSLLGNLGTQQAKLQSAQPSQQWLPAALEEIV